MEKATRREDTPMIPDEQRVCPICNLPTVRLIRGKIYCGNCGFIES
jgi:uncharacterized Zn finger protein (UPF0148 family)